MKKGAVLLIVLFLLLAAGGWYAYKEYNRKNEDLEKVESKISVDAAALMTAFEQDSVTANRTYLGKIIVVTGIVFSVEKEAGTTLILKSEGNKASVRCSMDALHSTAIGSIKNGQRISIKGECTGYTSDELGLGADVLLNRCVLQEQ
ncbi:MAG: hypothetical protein ABIN57_00640 [Chitinophagaceae bacterium]